MAANLLGEHLEFRVIMKNSDGGDGVKREERCLLGRCAATPTFVVDPERVQGVKVRLLGIGTPWSGEIPLQIERGRNHSALVRIPMKDKGQWQTVWCRTVEEVLETNPSTKKKTCKSLLIFSPMYMAKSLLPGTMKIILSSTNVNGAEAEIELPGRSLPMPLPTLGAADLKYNVALKVSNEFPASEPIAMTWGLIGKVREPEEKTSVDEIVEEIPKFGLLDMKTTWPFVTDQLDGDTLPPPLTCWNFNLQPHTDVQVSFSQYHPLCNTLCMQIKPWCLMVNQLGLPLVLKIMDDKKAESSFDIADQSVFVPPSINSSFCFGIQDSEGSKIHFGPQLHLSDQERHFRGFLPSVMEGTVPMEGIVQTKILLGSQICFLTISCRSENGIRIMHLKPSFYLSNRTERSVQVAAISIDQANSQKRTVDVNELDLIPMETPPSDDDCCSPLLLWQAMNHNNRESKAQGPRAQYIFLSFPSEGNGDSWCLPVRMPSEGSEKDLKWDVNVPNRQADEEGFVNQTLTVTLHQRSGQVYAILKARDSSSIVIENNLDVPFQYSHWNKQG